MIIRPSHITDIERMRTIFSEAKQKMRSSGNMLQWTDGYPSDEILRNDIENGISYMVEDEGIAIATFVFASGEDPTYKAIYNGHWLDDEEPYITIHRIASIEGAHGILSTVLEWADKRIANIRIDTHRDNHPMIHLLESQGFRYCGIIYLANGDERLAYQRLNTAH